MHIGILEVRGRINASHSLKDKRRVIQSAQMRIRNKLNLSVAEVGDQDLRQVTSLAVVGVGSSKQVVEQELGKALRLLENTDGLDIFDTDLSFM